MLENDLSINYNRKIAARRRRNIQNTVKANEDILDVADRNEGSIKTGEQSFLPQNTNGEVELHSGYVSYK